MKKILPVSLMSFLLLNPAAQAQRIKTLGAGELEIALHKLNVLGSVLFIAAHPDDENTSVLAYMSKGRKYRTAYLSLTRGDGGQNLIGPEKGAEIGILRTQELLAAREVDGGEQYFTRAVDFGYSKTAAETFDFWGREEILADIVWVIRTFRPDVIISRFSAEGSGGHGHHTASGLLVQEAFSAAADPAKFPEQLTHTTPWQAKRLFWNSWRPSPQEAEALVKVDTGEYNPLLGKSYSEMAAESRSKHRSQGFGSTGRRGTRYDYFQLEAGEPAATDLFDGIDTSWDRVPGAQAVKSRLDEVLKAFSPARPARSISGLLGVYGELVKLTETHWVGLKREELLRVIQSCAGLWLEAIADDYAAAPGDEMRIQITAVNRSDYPFRLEKIEFPDVESSSTARTDSNGTAPVTLNNNDPQTVTATVRIPDDFPVSQPYWLTSSPRPGLFSVRDQKIIGRAENPPAIRVRIGLSAGEHRLTYTLPLLFRWTDRAEGELYRQFEIRPPVTLQLEDKVRVFTNDEPREIHVLVKSHTPKASGTIRLEASKEWRIVPESRPFALSDKYAEQPVTFEIFPPPGSAEAVLTAEARTGGRTTNLALQEISYPHIKRQVYFPASRMKIVKLDINSAGGRVAYIMGAGDEVPDGVRNLGYEVTLMTDTMLENGDLSSFDAVIAGVRAYNTRERLKHIQPRLMAYVKEGGTYIVQYNVSRGLLTESIGPYPFSIGRDRVSDETAPIELLDAQHPLLRFPNRITQADFKGWVQERGLYFAGRWDERYETVLSSADPGESDKTGGILYGRYGKGIFIYTGYSWFRQLPAGVPGAYRLFANLISAGKAHE